LVTLFIWLGLNAYVLTNLSTAGCNSSPGGSDASAARPTYGPTADASARLPADNGHVLLTAAKDAFTDGLAIAAGVGSALLLAPAVAVWLLLKPRPAPLPNHPTGTLRPSPLRARK
jgi:hypothetical protein